MLIVTMGHIYKCFRPYAGRVHNSICTSNFLSSRLLSVTRSLMNDEINPSKSKPIITNEDAKLPKEEPIKKDELQLYQIPDEDPDIPKKHIFQQLRRVKLEGACYTLEEAARYKDPDSMTRSYKYPTVSDQYGILDYSLRSHDNQYSVITQFPDVTDMLIVGGGLIGSATAYYSKKMANRCGDIVVIDKDPYSPHNTTSISNGLISCQSKSRDISRLATVSKELIRNLKRDILVTDEDFAQIKYRPCTHLVLWLEEQADDAMAAVKSQIEDGCFIETRLPEELEFTFPWLKVSDSEVCIGTHGYQDEALIDPIGLRNLYRTLAQAHGANFIQAEAVDFNTQYNKNIAQIHNLSAGAMIARISSGELKNVCFAKTLLCCGHNTPFLEAQVEMEEEIRDSIQDLHFLQPKLRVCLLFKSLAAPIINFPVITDTDGSMLMRDDYAGSFKYYLTLEECEKFFDEDNEKFMNLESNDPYVNMIHKGKYFEDYFNNTIKPRLVNRIPVMEDAEFILAQSGFESYNTHDGSPLISLHPFHTKVMMSGGFGKRLATFGPAAGAALSELMLFDEEETFDCSNFYWGRVMKGRKVQEFRNFIA